MAVGDAMADVKLEELSLCTLVHFLVHPPANSAGVPFNPQRSRRDISLFLLKEIKVSEQGWVHQLESAYHLHITYIACMAMQTEWGLLALPYIFGAMFQAVLCPRRSGPGSSAAAADYLPGPCYSG